jgi:hypothetical protein
VLSLRRKFCLKYGRRACRMTQDEEETAPEEPEHPLDSIAIGTLTVALMAARSQFPHILGLQVMRRSKAGKGGRSSFFSFLAQHLQIYSSGGNSVLFFYQGYWRLGAFFFSTTKTTTRRTNPPNRRKSSGRTVTGRPRGKPTPHRSPSARTSP